MTPEWIRARVAFIAAGLDDDGLRELHGAAEDLQRRHGRQLDAVTLAAEQQARELPAAPRGDDERG